MLEYFGQSPIIVRSSSLLEDNYGNAFSENMKASSAQIKEHRRSG
jgi:hypothetical protein